MKPSFALEYILYTAKKMIPRGLFLALQPLYHYLLSLFGAILYRFPSREVTLIAITGTKGKTSVAEIVNAIFERAGYTTALSSTLRFKISERSEPNMFKMTLPGRFFLQKFLRRAVSAGCTHAIVEMTSEAAKQYRHLFLAFDALIFTNLAPEHIESHGSYERYLNAKLAIGRAVAGSSKPKTIIVANTDDPEGSGFLALHAKIRKGFSLRDAESYTATDHGITLTFRGEEIRSSLLGVFNIMNILAAATCAEAFGVPLGAIRDGVESCGEIGGRMESVSEGQDFGVYVDYAHTPDSLKAAYETFADKKTICVLGSTGGGRDAWKRPAMGEIADLHCSRIILTNEDPYDEDPEGIVLDIQKGITHTPCEIIIDRREAIKKALTIARRGDVVLITGKGTDPYIMGAGNTKMPWSDTGVTREELRALLASRKNPRHNGSVH